MSGGHFEYKQYYIEEIADEIQFQLDKQGTLKSKEDLWMQKEYYEEYPDQKYFLIYPTEVQDRMRQAVYYLRIAKVYAHRVDWYLSGDDGEESFISRLENELSNLTSKI
jgi:hypothetical protein